MRASSYVDSCFCADFCRSPFDDFHQKVAIIKGLSTETIAQVKAKYAEKGGWATIEDQRWICQVKELEDEKTLGDCGTAKRDEVVAQFVCKKPGG
jgi:hypothetical protein